jgi:hypothetical protein
MPVAHPSSMVNAAAVPDSASLAETGFTQQASQRILNLHRLLSRKVSLKDVFRP